MIAELINVPYGHLFQPVIYIELPVRIFTNYVNNLSRENRAHIERFKDEYKYHFAVESILILSKIIITVV